MVIPKKFNRKKVLTILGIYLLCLLCLEFVGQFVISYVESRRPSGIYAENIMSLNETMLDFSLKKGVDEDFPGWNVKTNSLGYRIGDNFELEKPKDTLRIVMVGGSTVFGWGVEYTDSIPSYLQHMIIKELKSQRGLASIGSNVKVEVINAGVPWYATWNESAIVLHRVLKLKPDWIIAFDGLNDAAKSLSPDWSPVYQGYEDIATNIIKQRRSHKFGFKDFVLEIIKLSPTLKYAFAKVRARQQLSYGAYHPEAWEQYVYYHKMMKSTCQGLGIKYSSFLQPVMMVDKPLHPKEEATNYTSMQDKTIAETFRQIYWLGHLAAAQSNLGIISLKSLFKDTKEVIYLDGLHYNGRGNLMLAEEIFEKEVKPNLASVLNSKL